RPHEADRPEDLLVDSDRRGRLRGVGLLAGALRFLRPGHLAALERTELDERRDPSEIDDLVVELEGVAEPAPLRYALVERCLTALEPGRDRAAGARLLALRAPPGGLAAAGGDAAAHPCSGRTAAGSRMEVVELHAFSSGAERPVSFGAVRPFVSGTSSTDTRNRTC